MLARHTRRLLVMAVLATPIAAAPALADPPLPFRAEVPLLDSIDVLVRDRSVLAVSAETGAQAARAKLELGEEALWVGVRGRVGLVVTDRRLLAITTTQPVWQFARFKARDAVPRTVLLGERVGLVATNHYLYGIAAAGGLLKVRELGAYENVLDDLVAENLAVVVTDRRLIGLSGFAGGFFEEPVGVHEDLDYANISAQFATVATDRRLLIFDADSGDWKSRQLNLRD
jgi:hypothetical protein